MHREDSHFDTWLDAALRDVPVPVGLLERLRQITVASDRELDAALRDVPVPAGLRARLERVVQRRGRLMQLGQMAAAASLFITIGLSYVGAVLGFLWTAYGSVSPPPPALVSQATARMLSESDRGEASDLEGLEIVFSGPEPPGPVGIELSPPAPGFTLVAYREPAYSVLSEMQAFFPGPYSPSGPDPWEGRTLSGLYVLPAPGGIDDLPEFQEEPGLDRKGVEIPLVDGVDVRFLIRTGFNPFVVPSQHRQLRTSVVPLAANTSSYDLAWKFLKRGELPPPGRLRTEEFLAAMDYRFPQPEGQRMGLYLGGAASPFWPVDRRLLQIGVQAREIPDGDRPGTHLTVAVDVSSSTGQGDRLDTVRRALRQLIRRIGPRDRVSLVAFSQDAYVLAEDVRPDGKGQLLAAIDSLATESSTNLLAGLRQAYAVAYRGLGAGEQLSRVVLITDGLAHLDCVTAERIKERLAEPAACGITLYAVELARERRYGQVNAVLAGLTHAGGGRVYWASSPDRVHSVLREIITGRPQLVACDVGLKVTFNPKTVAAYRLLGHEAGDVPAGLQIDFCAGQTATAVYEIQLTPRGGEEVAVAELAWRDPITGQPASLTGKFSREQFARTTLDAPLPVQAAAVVAEAAEVLRGSPFVGARPMSASLGRVLDRADQVDTQLRQRPAFREFVQLIKQAQAAKPYRSGGRE